MSASSPTTTPRTRVLALDLDGVLVHPAEEVGANHWSVNLLSDLGVDPQELAVAFFQKHWAQIVVGMKDLENCLSSALDELGSQVTARAIMDYWFDKDARLDLGVAEVASSWKAIAPDARIVVAFTNQERNRMQYLEDRFGLSRMFDHVFWSGEVGHSKKQWPFFDTALSRLNISASDVTFLDDEPAVVEVARSGGIDAHLYTGIDGMRGLLSV